MAERSYLLVPAEVGTDVFMCTECGRQIPAGYPFVAVPRDVARADAVVDGVGRVTDVLCVYCDNFPE